MLSRWSNHSLARRAFLLWLLLAGICMARPAMAIEKYGAVSLPDDGLGSATRGLTKVGAGTLLFGVVGSKQKSDGTVGAMYWSIAVDPSDPSGNTVFATELPKPPGMSAWATGIAFPGGNPDRPIICGFIGTDVTGTADLARAVIWRRDGSGQFSDTIFDDEAAVANGIAIRDTPLGLIIVVCGKFRLPNGDWHAAVWKIMSGIERADLGTLGGRNSEARAASIIDDLVGWNIVGSAERPNGRTLATCWTVRLTGDGGLDWFLRALPTPPGAESNAVYVGSANGGVWKTSGWIREPNGRTSASIWINQGEIPSAFTSQLYRDVLGRSGNSIANGIVDYIDQDDVLVVGTARNLAGRQRGVGALPFNQPFNDPFFFDALRASDPILDWNSISLNAVEPDGAIAGEELVSGSATPQATLFLPINLEVAQNLDILIGAVGQDRISDLWQEDGNALRVRPRPKGVVQWILAEWTSGHTTMGGAFRAPRNFTLVSRIVPRNANVTPSATLTLQLYDSSAGRWANVATRILASDEFFHSLVIEIPDPEQFAVSGSEPLRWRIGLRGEEWRDWDVDLMEMEVEEMP
ncbi:MAG: hypothetical protein ABI596_07275 [Pyrinomonadaceae bacterium]